MSIFEKDKSGALVDMNDPEFSKIFCNKSKVLSECMIMREFREILCN